MAKRPKNPKAPPETAPLRSGPSRQRQGEGDAAGRMARTNTIPIVAIGSSAGGVAALQELFKGMPTDLGVVFVVVSHLEPSHPSELVPILQRNTPMQVVEVKGEMQVQPNCIYVIAPDLRLAIADGKIAASPFEEPRGHRTPINTFFRSLADQHGDGFAIVLTGAGSDGAVGVKAVKEAGGVVLVQDPEDAEYPYMPQSAIATGAVDVIEPLHELPRRLAELVHMLFFEGGPSDAEVTARGESTKDRFAQLQEELEATQERLRASREEYEAANEELRAANEELQSMNEEYRSTAEELETSKEELQSMNEELQTLNSELKIKLEGVSRAHSDLENLVAATAVGTLFLDATLRIKRFTPPVAELFNIAPGDEGRRITDFTSRLNYENLEEDAQAVLSNLVPVERELEGKDRRWHQTGLRPYRTVDNRIDGVVITFIDITQRKSAEQRLRILTAELDHRVKNVLARVVALARLSGPHPKGSAMATFMERLRSMTRTHSLLSQSQWAGARLENICAAELEPYRTGKNVTVGKSNIVLNPDAAQALTLVIHELTTNAAKYGALSSPVGHVEVTMEEVPGDEIEFVWTESGGPAPKQETKNSYGSKIIRRSLVHEYGAKVEYDLKPEGLRCAIRLPLKAVEAKPTA